MAREVAVDVASHSPQVDPILDELTEVLADLDPMAPTIPFYSATLFDPRERPDCDAGYWVDNLRHTVRFAAAVQAALEDGYRVFAELAPHPLLTHAVEQTAASSRCRWPHWPACAASRAAARPARLCGGSAQRGRRGGLLGAVPGRAAGGRAAADLDAPSTLLSRATGRIHRRTARSTLSVHPLLGAHVRLPEEPERHVWQARGRHRGAAVAGRPQIHKRGCASRRRLLRDGAGRRPHRSRRGLRGPRRPLRADAAAGQRDRGRTAVGIGRRARRRHFTVETEQEANARSGPAPCCRSPRTSSRPHRTSPRCWRRTRAASTAPSCGSGSTARCAPSVRPSAGWRPRTPPTGRRRGTVLAEVGLPGSIRSQQGAYGVHPALLDACFQSVAAHPAVDGAGEWRPAAAVGCAADARLRRCPRRALLPTRG